MMSDDNRNLCFHQKPAFRLSFARPQLDSQTSDGRSAVPKINRTLHPFTARLMEMLISFRIY